jgi:hypothetical protein
VGRPRRQLLLLVLGGFVPCVGLLLLLLLLLLQLLLRLLEFALNLQRAIQTQSN